MRKLYCGTCRTHTEHKDMPAAYATICMACGAHTSQLIRMQAESQTFTAPDGTPAVTVENGPDKATFHIASGEYKGYYHYDKRTKAKRIEQG